MNIDSTKLVLDKIDQLVDKAGAAGEKVWPWLIKQQYIDALSLTLLTFILGGVTSLFIWFTIKHWRPETGYSIYDNDMEGIFVGIAIFLSFIFIILFCFSLGSLTHLFNVDYWALQDLLSQIK